MQTAGNNIKGDAGSAFRGPKKDALRLLRYRTKAAGACTRGLEYSIFHRDLVSCVETRVASRRDDDELLPQATRRNFGLQRKKKGN